MRSSFCWTCLPSLATTKSRLAPSVCRVESFKEYERNFIKESKDLTVSPRFHRQLDDVSSLNEEYQLLCQASISQLDVAGLEVCCSDESMSSSSFRPAVTSSLPGGDENGCNEAYPVLYRDISGRPPRDVELSSIKPSNHRRRGDHGHDKEQGRAG